MRHRVLISLISVSLILAMTIPAVAADRTGWYGKSNGKKGPLRFLFIKNDFTWTLGSNARSWDDTEWRTVEQNDEYTELQLKGTKVFNRCRLYTDCMMVNEEGSRTKWFTCAEGYWLKD